MRPSEIAYHHIKDRIISGEYLPAQRLIEAQLAEEIQVSRNTVRKALQMIENEKLIIIKENVGAMVSYLDTDEILQYYEIRKSLELIVMESAVKKISQADLGRLSETIIKMETLSSQHDFDEYSLNNLLFHDIIYEASEKPIAVGMIQEIKTQLKRYQIRTMLVPGRANTSLEEHKRIYQALVNRDVDAACSAIEEHMSGVSETITKFKTLFT